MRCDLCGSTRSRQVANKNGYWIVRCLDCGMIQADVPGNIEDLYREDSYFTKVSTGTTFGVDMLDRRVQYDNIPLNERTFDLFNGFWMRGNKEEFQNKRVLEIGPSPNGGTIKYLTSLRYVDGLEISQYATDYLRKLGFSIYCGSITDVRIGKTYDIILAYEVVEHLKDPKSAFSNIYNHLAPGGVFIFSTGNAGSIKARLKGRKWEYFLPPQHLFYYSERTIRRYLQGAGFKNTDITLNKYSLWSKRQAVKLGFPNALSRLFLCAVSNLTSGMTVYASR